MSETAPIVLAITGASGSAYGLRLLEVLLQQEREVWLLVSKAGRMVLKLEADLEVPARPEEMRDFFCALYDAPPERLTVFGREDWLAPIASGSHPAQAMVVCPCTTGTLAAIAHGSSDDLLERAADVMLKERRQLILVLRETPLSVIHLENMLAVARAGATVLPANPGFYHRPQTVAEVVDFIVARVLDHLAVPHDLLPRWGLEE